jgi:hypothetical protein
MFRSLIILATVLYSLRYCQHREVNKKSIRTGGHSHFAVASKFCMVVPNICGSSVRNLLQVILLPPRILRWLLDFWKFCAPVHWNAINRLQSHLACYP